MSLPAVGDVVTVVFEFGGAGVPVPGRIVGAGQFPDEDLHMLWESPGANGMANYCIRARFEGVYWMHGCGPEVDGALLAAYALAGGRGPGALSGEL